MRKRCSFQSGKSSQLPAARMPAAGKGYQNFSPIRAGARACRARQRLGDLTENHERQVAMNRHRIFLAFVTLATVAATPAPAQTATPVVGAASGATNGVASIPDFSGVWTHPA